MAGPYRPAGRPLERCDPHRYLGAECRALLSRAKIVFNRSIRSEANMRAFEAAAAGRAACSRRPAIASCARSSWTDVNAFITATMIWRSCWNTT